VGHQDRGGCPAWLRCVGVIGLLFAFGRPVLNSLGIKAWLPGIILIDQAETRPLIKAGFFVICKKHF
jgi:hypothetical protein